MPLRNSPAPAGLPTPFPAYRLAAVTDCRSPLAHPRWIWALASIALLVGCGEGKIARYPVTGTVLVDGKPYEGARVMFCPEGGSEAFSKERPYGVTDQSGKFELTTFIKGDGAPAGDYKIMIRNGRPQNADEAKRWARRPKLPRKYGKPDLSGVTATVNAEPTELAAFELATK